MGKRKNLSDHDNINKDFCNFLIELAMYERNTNGNIYKYNAYRKAANALAAYPKRIKSGNEAKQLNGIGSKISDKIEEFLQTGKLEKLEKIKDDHTNTAINLFTRISGIGPTKARELVDGGILTLEDLKKNLNKLTHHQLIGLKYMDDFEQKIPRTEIEEIKKVLEKEISELDTNYSITICGSYRRGQSESGDIDVLLTHSLYDSKCKDKILRSKYLKNVVDTLMKNNLITETISLGDHKFMGTCKMCEVTRRLDIRLIPFDQYYCGILYFTGSDMFNKTMRAHALEQKFTLNEYSLRPIGSTGVPGNAVPITCEKDIFDYIDYPYKQPEERNM